MSLDALFYRKAPYSLEKFSFLSLLLPNACGVIRTIDQNGVIVASTLAWGL